MELFAAFEGSVASTAEIVKAAPASQMSAPTPCAEWDVRALLNHVIGTLWLAEALFSRPGRPGTRWRRVACRPLTWRGTTPPRPMRRPPPPRSPRRARAMP